MRDALFWSLYLRDAMLVFFESFFQGCCFGSLVEVLI